MTDPSATLCEQAKAGQPEAAAELVARHYEALFGWFRRLCGHEQDAADLTQKTFGQAWRALDSFQGRSSFSTWLHGIGHHVYVDWRRRQTEPVRFDADWWMNCPQDGPGPFETAADRELAEHLYALVEQLAEETRETVHLHYYQGLSIAETADVLGIAIAIKPTRCRSISG